MYNKYTSSPSSLLIHSQALLNGKKELYALDMIQSLFNFIVQLVMAVKMMPLEYSHMEKEL